MHIPAVEIAIPVDVGIRVNDDSSVVVVVDSMLGIQSSNLTSLARDWVRPLSRPSVIDRDT
jgi:hypothetical protein